MSTPYSIARAELIASQIARFATQHLHQLAGHHENLDFWMQEAASAVRTIDEYPQRFKQLKSGQLAWVGAHDTKITRYCPICRGGCEFDPQTPPRPQRVPSDELAAARESVRRATRQFLVRLHQAGFISEAIVRKHAEAVGAAIEPEDLA